MEHATSESKLKKAHTTGDRLYQLSIKSMEMNNFSISQIYGFFKANQKKYSNRKLPIKSMKQLIIIALLNLSASKYL